MPPDGPGFVDAFAGAMQQGAVPLPVNPLLPVREVVAVTTGGRCPVGGGLGGSDASVGRPRRRATGPGWWATGDAGSRAELMYSQRHGGLVTGTDRTGWWG